MTRPLPFLLAFPLLLGTAIAQTPAPSSAAPAKVEAAPAAPATPSLLAPASSGTPTQSEIDQKIQEAVAKEVAKVKEQLRDEVRAEIQGAQSAAEFLGEQDQKKKLHFLELNGYYRFRFDLFTNMNGGMPADPMGWYYWNGNVAVSTSPPNGTQTSGNMRLRVDPTFNVSEQVRVKMEIDFLDNVVLGSTPIGASYNLYGFQANGQIPPAQGYNWFWGAVQVKRAWGEVQTPVGLLSFGRMPADWGAGIYYNAGGGIDQDYGDNVDRIQFSIPLGQFLGGLALTPYYEWAGSGLTYASTFTTGGIGQPMNYTQDDDVGTVGFMAARTDTPDQVRRKLEKGATSLNFGLLFNYKSQRLGLPMMSLSGQPVTPTWVEPNGTITPVTLVNRNASAFTLDGFVRWVGKRFEIELEGIGITGSIGNVGWDPLAAPVPATISQAAAVLKGNYKLGDGGRFVLGGEAGIASGDSAPGFGNNPGRCNLQAASTDPLPCGQVALPGSIDGNQTGISNSTMNNYRFNPAYQIDLILWRRILGTVTDAWYLKPTFRWDVLDGLTVSGQVVYSQAIFATSTPSKVNRPLGLELDLGVKYQSDDGFVFFLDYGLLRMLSGFEQSTTVAGTTVTTGVSGVAQNLHAGLGIVF